MHILCLVPFLITRSGKPLEQLDDLFLTQHSWFDLWPGQEILVEKLIKVLLEEPCTPKPKHPFSLLAHTWQKSFSQNDRKSSPVFVLIFLSMCPMAVLGHLIRPYKWNGCHGWQRYEVQTGAEIVLVLAPCLHWDCHGWCWTKVSAMLTTGKIRSFLILVRYLETLQRCTCVYVVLAWHWLIGTCVVSHN